MSLRINTNVASYAIQNAMQVSDRQVTRAMKNLSTGSRLSDPSVDPASAAINNDLGSTISSMGAAKRNAEQATSFAAVAEGGMSEQSNLLVRMRELAIQSASDTYSDRERGFMQNEFEKLGSEVERIAQTSSFGSRKLLDGSSHDIDVQVGTKGDANSRISFSAETDTTASGLGISGLSVAEKSDARDALDSLDSGLDKISSQRSKYGAFQSRLESAQNSLGANIENLSGAKSKIGDADISKEVSDLRKAQVLQQYQANLLSQANEQTGLALKLIA